MVLNSTKFEKITVEQVVKNDCSCIHWEKRYVLKQQIIKEMYLAYR